MTEYWIDDEYTLSDAGYVVGAQDDDEYEEHYGITGCTCMHVPNDHDWEHCTVGSCPCEGCWEEW